MRVVLFDMDGTLTPPRGVMGWPMVGSLYELQDAGYEIGIVSGSDLDYIKQQCVTLFDLTRVDCTSIHWLPCNGTKYYKYTRENMLDPYEFKSVYENNIRSYLGEEKWRRLIQLVMNLQNAMTRVHRGIPLSGTFIQYRGSTVNWCPIGRSATTEDRELWSSLNKDNSIRKSWIDLAKAGLKSAELDDVIIKFGGDTSFDIYPVGWDKTLAFKNFKDYEDIYFIGDRCDPTGNDFEAYQLAGKKGFKTSSPAQTIEIISKILSDNSNG
jgi:phosphomannomutase